MLRHNWATGAGVGVGMPNMPHTSYQCTRGRDTSSKRGMGQAMHEAVLGSAWTTHTHTHTPFLNGARKA